MSQRGMRSVGIALVLTAISLMQGPRPLRAEPPVAFTHGVASGDVNPFSAVLWTRVDRETPLQVEVSTDPDFHRKQFHQTVRAAAAHDFTAKVLAAPLTPNQLYYYRWRHGSAMSEVGTFKTAPLPTAAANVRFAWSGDTDGTMVGRVPFYNHFEALDRVRLENPDFFIYLGDTIYADSIVPGATPATTLDEYRHAYKANREIAALRNLLGATSSYTIWDDHEVRDDFAGLDVDPMLLANGRQAFLEYMPISTTRLSDPACAADPLFRVFRWGKEVEIFVLDERACRSAEAKADCLLAPGVLDLAPTMPGPLRVSFGLPFDPPAGCLATIFNPSRTLLGPVQKARFKETLLDSPARFKFIVNEVAIQQRWVLPYYRWEGYGAERAEILNFIRDNGIANVIFLTTDDHLNLITPVLVDRFADPQTIAPEFITGPIAELTAEQTIEAFFGAQFVPIFQGILSLVGAECRHLNAYSYGVVKVDAAAGTATLTLKNDMGEVISDQVDPTIQCTKTLP